MSPRSQHCALAFAAPARQEQSEIQLRGRTRAGAADGGGFGGMGAVQRRTINGRGGHGRRCGATGAVAADRTCVAKLASTSGGRGDRGQRSGLYRGVQWAGCAGRRSLPTAAMPELAARSQQCQSDRVQSRGVALGPAAWRRQRRTKRPKASAERELAALWICPA